MYSLIIADDEYMMRNGLTKIVQWEKQGFTLKAVCSDGAEVIDQLRSEPPDILLLDIRMSCVNGLEVAKFVSENALPVKVILLSGYREFELAQEALRYHVYRYLLKPISVPKLKEVFAELKEELDRQNVVEEALQYRMDCYRQMVDYERERFLCDVLLGSLRSPDELEMRLQFVGWKDEQPFSLYQIEFTNPGQLEKLAAEYGSQEILDQIYHLLNSFDQRVRFYSIESTLPQMKGMFLWNGEAGALPDPAVLESLISQMFVQMMGVDVQTHRIQYFENIQQMVHYQQDICQQIVSEDFACRIREQKKLIRTLVSENEWESAGSALVSFVNQAGMRGIAYAKNQTILLFSAIMEHLDELADAEHRDMEISFLSLGHITDEAGLICWGQSTLRSLRELVPKASKTDEGSCITKLKRYIGQHYAEDITLSDAAESVYLHPIYVSRLFREKTGQTFTEYLTHVRIEAAKALLEQREKYVYEISEAVGYHNLKYFYKVFRKITGHSPSEYLEKGK